MKSVALQVRPWLLAPAPSLALGVGTFHAFVEPWLSGRPHLFARGVGNIVRAASIKDFGPIVRLLPRFGASAASPIGVGKYPEPISLVRGAAG